MQGFNEQIIDVVRIDSTMRPACGYWDFDRDTECYAPANWIYESPNTLNFLCDRCKAAVVDIAPTFHMYFRGLNNE